MYNPVHGDQGRNLRTRARPGHRRRRPPPGNVRPPPRRRPPLRDTRLRVRLVVGDRLPGRPGLAADPAVADRRRAPPLRQIGQRWIEL